MPSGWRKWSEEFLCKWVAFDPMNGGRRVLAQRNKMFARSDKCWRAQTRSNCSRQRAFISEGTQAWALRKYANRLMNIHTVQGKLEATGAPRRSWNAQKKTMRRPWLCCVRWKWTNERTLFCPRLGLAAQPSPQGSLVNLQRSLNPKSRPLARISMEPWINLSLSLCSILFLFYVDRV